MAPADDPDARSDAAAAADGWRVPEEMARRQALALYASRASLYDLELAPFQALRDEALALLDASPGETVLDMGCGTGLSLPALAERVGELGHVIGVEQSEPMLQRARERMAVHPQGHRCSLIEAPAEQLPWSQPQHRCADAALFFFTHDILQSPAAVQAVMARLKPGARVVAAGLVWAPWHSIGSLWANAFVMASAWYSVCQPEGLAAPWKPLLPHLQDVLLQRRWHQSVYLLQGRT